MTRAYRRFVTTSLVLLAAATVHAAPRVTVEYFADTNTLAVEGEGATATIPEVAALAADQGHPDLLDARDDGSWLVGANLQIRRGVTLRITSDDVTTLKLLSAPGAFVSLVTYDGTIIIDGVKITSWNPGAGAPDTNLQDGRAFVLAKYAARMDIRNAELTHLGYDATESYGVSWRDVGDENGRPNTRVTGNVVSSRFEHNYFGVYTYQASRMVFRKNTFSHNVAYGFDPHDHSHHFIVADNEAAYNGAHGFIASRGCHNFVFVRNIAHHNAQHGFMLDPGAPEADAPQIPTFNILLRGNRAWDNQGNGLRVLQARDTTVERNLFQRNKIGVSVEGSEAITIRYNVIRSSRVHGVDIEGATGTRVAHNLIDGNAEQGVNISSGSTRSLIDDNTIRGNGGWGVKGIGPETRENSWGGNLAYGNGLGAMLRQEANEGIPNPAVTEVIGNTVRGRAPAGSTVHVYSDMASQARFLEGRVTAGPDGKWQFSASLPLRGRKVTALATDSRGNSSSLSPPLQRQ